MLVSAAARTPSWTTLVHGVADEDRLIAEKRNVQRIGQAGLDFRDLVLDAFDDGQRRNRAVLQHRQQHRARAVDVDDVGLRRITVADVGHVADVDHARR